MREHAWLSTLLLAACGPDVATDVASQALINGSFAGGSSPYVGWIGAPSSGCTATLIGRRTALTAAHCFADHEHVAFCVYPCANLSGCTPQCADGFVIRDPAYTESSSVTRFDHDAAIVKLASDFTTLTGIQPRRIGSTPGEGASMRLVGYGCTDPANPVGTAGVLYTGTNTIDAVTAERLEYDDTSRAYSCAGDSGGPALIEGTDCELGVMVGQQTSCTLFICDTDWQITRLDTKLAWIQSASQDPSVHGCGQAACGDAFCQSPESCASCPLDCGTCGPVCGDHVCADGETAESCPVDCGPVCGNGECEAGESCTSCPDDCPCPCPPGRVHCCGELECIPAPVCRRRGC